MISAILATQMGIVNARHSNTENFSSDKSEGAFQYSDERFADLQMLRYRVEGFENLTLKQKTFIYYLQEAALYG